MNENAMIRSFDKTCPFKAPSPHLIGQLAHVCARTAYNSRAAVLN